MKLKLVKLTTKSGQDLVVSDGLTVIVGPNNAGKSGMLREFHERLSSDQVNPLPHHKVFDSYEISYDTVDEFRAWLRQNYIERPPGQYQDGNFSGVSYRIAGGILQDHQIDAYWGSQMGVSNIAPAFTLYLDAQNRLGLVGNSGSFNRVSEHPGNPLQRMAADRSLEAEVSTAVKRAFGDAISVDRYAGSQLMLHLGAMDSPEPLPDTPEAKLWQQKLAALPLLQDQGDGIKAFVGILMAIMTAQYPLVIIDEPEAFLHPPQAYLLGQMLAEQHAKGTQVLIATHSADVIAGIASVQASNVSIARLTRRGDRNNLASIQPEKLRVLYNDPLIKYYPIMDGLFARGAIVCEADSDCTYYRAALESMGAMPDGTPVASLAMHFTHCNGKTRMPRAVEALKSAEVPVVSVVDIDILQNANEFEALVTAHSGDASPLAGRRNTIIDAVNARAVRVKRVPALAEIEAIFAKSTAEYISNGDADKVRAVVAPKSGWGDFKEVGADRLQGGALVAFNEIDQELRKLGIFMVRQGELEQFHPEISSKNKAEWLRQVLEAELYKKSEEAHQLLRDIAQYIAKEQ